MYGIIFLNVFMHAKTSETTVTKGVILKIRILKVGSYDFFKTKGRFKMRTQTFQI